MVVAPTKKHASPNPMSTRVPISHSSDSIAPAHSAVVPDDQRAADHQDASAEAVTDASRQWSQQDRAHRERTHRETDGDVVAPQGLVDVARDDGQHRAHRREVAEARDDHDHEALGHERRLRRDRAVGAAAPHDAQGAFECVLERRALLDHLPILHDLGRHGKSECADQATGATEHRDEPTFLERAVHDLHVVVAPVVPDGLDLAVVLVGPHERHRRVRLGRAAVGDEQAPGRRDPLLGGVGPVLEPHELAVEHRVGPARDVAGRDDARRGEQRLVAHDAVVEGEPGALQPVGDRHHAHAHHHDVGVDGAAVVETHALDLAVTLDGGDTDAETQVDAVIAVQLAAHHAEGLAQAAHERRGEGFEHGHLQAAPAARRRHLGTDEAGADHDDARVAVEAGAEVERVVDGPQHEDAVEVGRVGERARRCTGREERAVERQLLAAPSPESRVSTFAAASSAVARTPRRRSSCSSS